MFVQSVYELHKHCSLVQSHRYGPCSFSSVILVFIVFPSSLCKSENKHQINPLENTEIKTLLEHKCLPIWPADTEAKFYVCHMQYINKHHTTIHVKTIYTVISTKQSKRIFIQRKYKVSYILVAYWRWILLYLPSNCFLSNHFVNSFAFDPLSQRQVLWKWKELLLFVTIWHITGPLFTFFMSVTFTTERCQSSWAPITFVRYEYQSTEQIMMI